MTDQPEKIEPTDDQVRVLTDTFIVDRMKFVAQMPFYGILLMELQAVATGPEIPVAAVNYRDLFLNATGDSENNLGAYSTYDFIGRKTLLAHEICHLVFEHLSIPADFDKNIANIAMDAVINRILQKDSNFDLSKLPPGCVLPCPGGITVGYPEAKQFKIPDFEDKDWLPIYWDIHDQLQKDAEKNCRSMSGEEQRKAIAEQIKEAAKELGDSNPMNGDAGQSNQEGDGAEEEQQKAKFRQKVISALETCKTRGDVPAEFQRLVDELQNGKVHWTSYLRRLIKTEIARDDFSQRPNSRRAHIQFGGRKRPPIFPKIESEALGDVFLALDTSGSMSETDIREGLSEFAGLRQTTPFNLYFVSCDAAAYEVTTYTKDEEPDWVSMPISGGGGTDFTPVFDLVEQYKKEKAVRPALLVYFTDTMGSFPEKAPEYPVIWVCNYKGGKVPFGQLISTVD